MDNHENVRALKEQEAFYEQCLNIADNKCAEYEEKAEHWQWVAEQWKWAFQCLLGFTITSIVILLYLLK